MELLKKLGFSDDLANMVEENPLVDNFSNDSQGMFLEVMDVTSQDSHNIHISKTSKPYSTVFNTLE